MKNIAELVPQINIVNTVDNSKKQQQKEQVAEVVNKLFSQLRAACPAMFHTLNHNDENAIKRQWIVGFIENGINPAMINAGMRIARQQNNPFMPSVGQFIGWCERGLAEQYGLPTAENLTKAVIEFGKYKGFDDFCNYDYGSDANYWLINDLHRLMLDENLGKEKLLIRAEKMISEMAKKIMTGWVIPTPNKSLPKTVQGKPLSREGQLSKLYEIKQKFGFGHVTSS